MVATKAVLCAEVASGIEPGLTVTVTAADIKAPNETVENPFKLARVLVAVLVAAASIAAAKAPSSVLSSVSDSTVTVLVRENPNG